MTEEDHYMYVKMSKDKFVTLSLYVDDILLAYNDKKFLLEIKEWLSSAF